MATVTAADFECSPSTVLKALRREGRRDDWEHHRNITRRELRKWLRASNEGKDVETAVARLLAGGQK